MTNSELIQKIRSRLSPNAVTSLEWAGAASDESIAADVTRVRAGESSALLAECLSGVEEDDGDDAHTVAGGYREYVTVLDAVVSAAREVV